jgi:hypothetical protein
LVSVPIGEEPAESQYRFCPHCGKKVQCNRSSLSVASAATSCRALVQFIRPLMRHLFSRVPWFHHCSGRTVAAMTRIDWEKARRERLLQKRPDNVGPVLGTASNLPARPPRPANQSVGRGSTQPDRLFAAVRQAQNEACSDPDCLGDCRRYHRPRRRKQRRTGS